MSHINFSSSIKRQIPEFIRDENPKFLLFLQKYYEWMEQEGKPLEGSFELSNSKDLDLVNNFYLEEIVKEILPFFPQESLLDKRKFLKLSSEFYKSKGTPDSVKFLFKILYNENIEIYYPKEQVLKTSDGKWVLPLALRVETPDLNIFDIENTKITGEQSKATAVVEKVIKSIDRQLGIEYIELYISNINKLFTTGENVSSTIVRTNGTQDFVTAKLIGSLSEIKIDPKNRGLFYNGYNTETNYPGDPVTIVGGLNPTSGTTVGAVAHVGDVLSGTVENIFLFDGGFGFRSPSENPNSSILDFRGGFEGGIFGQEAKASILFLDDNYSRTVRVSDIAIDFYSPITQTIEDIDPDISNGGTYDPTDPNPETTSKEINDLTTKQELSVASIAYVNIDASGGGYRRKPDLDLYSLYLEDLGDSLIINSTVIIADTNVVTDYTQDLRDSFEAGQSVRLFVKNKMEEVRVIKAVYENYLEFDSVFPNNVDNVSVYRLDRRKLNDVGALGRMRVNYGGSGYSVGDTLIFTTNGRGYGAEAEVTEIHSGNTGIKTVEFIAPADDSYVVGGEAYSRYDLPTVTVNSPGGGVDAQIEVTEILGEGTDLDLVTSRIGAISTIRVISYGYDYIEAPRISLRNADITLTGVTEGQVFSSNTFVYQGSSNTSFTWGAYVDSFTPSTNFLRVFDYTGTFDLTATIISDDGLVEGTPLSHDVYGDGKAKATASFENGLIRYPGIYVGTDGQLSSDQKLQDDKKYHNYSYVINTENDYYKFKKSLQEMVHPIGTKAFVVKIDEQQTDVVDLSITSNVYSRTIVNDTFEINESSNNLIGTGSLVLSDYVSPGDYVILTEVFGEIGGTVSVAESSNVITGSSTNFINDLYDGQKFYLSSGDSANIVYIIDETTAYTDKDFTGTLSGLTLSKYYEQTANVNFSNTDMILVDTTFTTTNNQIEITVQKVR